MPPTADCEHKAVEEPADALTALLDRLAGDEGSALALGARGKIREGTWRLVWTANSFDDPAKLDYEIAAFYEHFSHEARLAVLRTMMRAPDERPTIEEITRTARLACPEEAAAHLQALAQAGFVRAEGEGWRLLPVALGWVAVLLAVANLRLMVVPTATEGG